MTKQTFIVEGGGYFPLDMLRYDMCYPYSQEDAAAIDSSEFKPIRQVKLARIVRNKNIRPTEDRWSSFGWTVLPQSIELFSL